MAEWMDGMMAETMVFGKVVKLADLTDETTAVNSADAWVAQLDNLKEQMLAVTSVDDSVLRKVEMMAVLMVEMMAVWTEPMKAALSAADLASK